MLLISIDDKMLKNDESTPFKFVGTFTISVFFIELSFLPSCNALFIKFVYIQPTFSLINKQNTKCVTFGYHFNKDHQNRKRWFIDGDYLENILIQNIGYECVVYNISLISYSYGSFQSKSKQTSSTSLLSNEKIMNRMSKTR